MSRSACIIDTNIVVAGLLTAHDDSPVARVLDGMLMAAFPFVLSEPLLAEYHAVLVRPHLRKLHGLTSHQIENLLVDLTHKAIMLMPVSAMPAPDPNDQHLWELLAVRPELILVTGDKQLLASVEMSGRVISAEKFLESFSA